MRDWAPCGLAAALLLGTAASAYAAAPVCTLKFKPHTLSTGSNPQTIVTGDFNRDGKLDFAHVDYSGGGAGQVSVFLGNGDGTFARPATYATGSGPDGLAVADVNGDGIADLVVANDTGSSVSVLPGKGDGTFGTRTDYATGASSFPHWVAVGDFNGDHAPDIAVANEGANTVGVFLNRGDGTYGAMTSYGVSTEPYSVAAGDFRHDGKIDLAVTGYYYSVVSVLLGNGDGTFQSHVDYATGTAPAVVMATDFNRDKSLDLATVNYNNGQTGSVSILLGHGDGTFAAHSDYPVGLGPDGLAVGRFNGDRNLDLAVANLIGNTMSILAGNGDGTFGADQEFPTDEYPLGIAAGNFRQTKKTRQDVVVTNDLSNEAIVFLNKSRGCE